MINSKDSGKNEISGKEEFSAENSSVATENKRAENHRTLLERYEKRLKNLILNLSPLKTR